MLSNKKVSNALVDRKEAVGSTLLAEKESATKDAEKGTDGLADTLLSEKKSSTNFVEDVEKGTDELADILFSKKKLVTERDKKGTGKLVDTLLYEKKNQQRKWIKVLIKRQIRNYLRRNP